jgi:very-short-patch-repair endonuclease
MSLSKNPKLIVISKQLCRNLRKQSTPAEAVLWKHLRNRKLINRKFYRQFPLFFDMYGKETFFIADFFCFEDKFIIEVDGGYHERQKDYDALRTHIINMLGYEVIRFTNDEVEKNIKKVLDKIIYNLKTKDGEHSD